MTDPRTYPPSVGQEPYSVIIKALAALVTLPQTDKQFDADVLPRDLVMAEVTRIRHALDELMKFVPKVDLGETPKPPSALAERVARAQAEIATWSPERLRNCQLQGGG